MSGPPWFVSQIVGIAWPDGTALDAHTLNVAVLNLPATQVVSGTVNVGNLPATQAVSGSVSVSNLPATQPVSGSVSISNFPTSQAVKSTVPVGTDILANTLAANGTFFTVPAGRVWKGSISASASITVVGNAGATIAAGGTTYYSLVCSGLALTASTNAGGISDVYIPGGASGTPVTLAVGGSGTTSASACGVLL